MITKQWIKVEGIYGTNSTSAGIATNTFPAIGLGVKGEYEISVVNPSELNADGINSWMFAIGQDWDQTTPILFETTGVSLADGVFTVSGMEGTRTNEMLSAMGAEETVRMIGELMGFSGLVDRDHPATLIQWPMFLRNRVDADGQPAPTPSPDFVTWEEMSTFSANFATSGELANYQTVSAMSAYATKEAVQIEDGFSDWTFTPPTVEGDAIFMLSVDGGWKPCTGPHGYIGVKKGNASSTALSWVAETEFAIDVTATRYPLRRLGPDNESNPNRAKTFAPDGDYATKADLAGYLQSKADASALAGYMPTSGGYFTGPIYRQETLPTIYSFANPTTKQFGAIGNPTQRGVSYLSAGDFTIDYDEAENEFTIDGFYGGILNAGKSTQTSASVTMHLSAQSENIYGGLTTAAQSGNGAGSSVASATFTLTAQNLEIKYGSTSGALSTTSFAVAESGGGTVNDEYVTSGAVSAAIEAATSGGGGGGGGGIPGYTVSIAANMGIHGSNATLTAAPLIAYKTDGTSVTLDLTDASNKGTSISDVYLLQSGEWGLDDNGFESGAWPHIINRFQGDGWILPARLDGYGEREGLNYESPFTQLTVARNLTITNIYFNAWCLLRGTLVTLADGTKKPIEEIRHTDKLLVWNFDEGRFDAAFPLWMRQAGISDAYAINLFDDGTKLLTTGKPHAGFSHRIFNLDKSRFEYTADSVGQTAFAEDGKIRKLVKSTIAEGTIEYYNIITDMHFNLFCNGLLTSCSLNNLYPIKGMRFVKTPRPRRSLSDYSPKVAPLYAGLRLAEQTGDIAKINEYVEGRIDTAAKR